MLSAPKSFDFYPYGPYDSAIPKPESILGYQPGEKHTTFREQEIVINAITKAAPKRTKIFEFGRSWENRPLKLIAIGSEENIARLELLRKRMATLAAGQQLKPNELADLPAFVWINQTIHGNESASFEAAMWTLYNLTASKGKAIIDAFKNTIVLLNPVYNPDGHERFVVWNRSLAVSSDHPQAFEGFEPRWVHGRTNHYRFDMNRDRIAFSQAETIAEVREYNRWTPQVYIDQHGQTEEYFFPPNAMATNINVNRERLEKWTQIFGRSYAKAFDKQGWLYYVRDGFDFYAPCYLDTYAQLLGAIGMTHETDGGRRLNDTKDDGSPLTVELGMAKHFTTAITTVLTASANHDDLMESFISYRTKATSGDHAGKFKRVVVTSADPRPLKRLVAQLSRAGIQSFVANSNFSSDSAHDYWSETVGAKDFPAGSLVVDMAQPNGQLAKALLEPGQDFEKEFTANQVRIGEKIDKKDQYPDAEFPEFYDITGWSVIYGHNLAAWWCESASAVQARPAPFVDLGSKIPGLNDSDVGYAFEYTDQNDILAIFQLALDGVKCRVMTKDMKLGDRTFAKGTFYILKGRNDDDLNSKLEGVAKKFSGLKISKLETSFPESGRNSPGGPGQQAIREPKIGVIFGDNSSTQDFGALWYLLEQDFKIPFVPLHKNALNGDLSEFSCILFPSGSNTASDKVKSWIQGGGCAIVLGSPDWAIGDGKFAKLDKVGDDKSSPKSIPGTFFLAELDPRSFLSHGYPPIKTGKMPFAIQADGNDFWKGGTGGLGAVTFGDSEKKLLSGWSWPNDSEKNLKGVHAVYEMPIGSGKAIIFSWNPCERAMLPGQNKVLLNAMLLGPG